MSEYVVFPEESLHSFYDPATCSYMVPLSGKAAHDMGVLREENDALKAENAKLRKLVRFIMHQCNDGNPRCDECVGWNGGECVALLRMRELGVEVSE